MATCIECGGQTFKRRIVYICLSCGRVNSMKAKALLENHRGNAKRE